MNLNLEKKSYGQENKESKILLRNRAFISSPDGKKNPTGLQAAAACVPYFPVQDSTYPWRYRFGASRAGTYSLHTSAPGTAPDSLTSHTLPGWARRPEPPRLPADSASLPARVLASGSWGRRMCLFEQREQPVAPRAAVATSPTAPQSCGTEPTRRRRSPSQRAKLDPSEWPRLPKGPTPLACQRLTPSQSAPSLCSASDPAGCSPFWGRRRRRRRLKGGLRAHPGWTQDNPAVSVPHSLW